MGFKKRGNIICQEVKMIYIVHWHKTADKHGLYTTFVGAFTTQKEAFQVGDYLKGLKVKGDYSVIETDIDAFKTDLMESLQVCIKEPRIDDE